MNDTKRVIEVLNKNRKQQEIMYRTLLHCRETRWFNEVEAFVAQQPEMVYGQILQLPRTILGFLIDAGGLQCAEDAEHPDDCTVVATEAGAEAARLFDPLLRMESLLASNPRREDAFLYILAFCSEARTFPEIEKAYENEATRLCDPSDACSLTAEYFVSKLEKAGGLVWKKHWISTEKGREFAQRAVGNKRQTMKNVKEDRACLEA